MSLGETPRSTGLHRIPGRSYLTDANYAGKGLISDVKRYGGQVYCRCPRLHCRCAQLAQPLEFSKPEDFVFGVQRSENG
jgi:hypothetical protein